MTAGRFLPRNPDGCGKRTRITSPRFKAPPKSHHTHPFLPTLPTFPPPTPGSVVLALSAGCHRIRPPPLAVGIHQLGAARTSRGYGDLPFARECPGDFPGPPLAGW